MFALHPRLEADSLYITDLGICQARLMNDQRVPWVVLIPQVDDARELHHLPGRDRENIWEDIHHTATVMEQLFAPDKINLGALGNLVPQLHIHVVCRFQQDPAWPGPIWGAGTPVPYDPQKAEETLARLKKALE